MKDTILKIKTLDGITHEIDIDGDFNYEYNKLVSKQDKMVLFPQEIDNDFLLYCFDKLKIKKDDVFEIEFPKSITKIFGGTFWKFKNLRGVKFNGSIEEIGYNNFSHAVPDLKGIWFADKSISKSLSSVSKIKDNIPKDLEIFGELDGEPLYNSNKKNYQQFIEDSKNRVVQKVCIEFKLKGQTNSIKLEHEFEDSESANKCSCVLTGELLEKILESATFDFERVEELKISGVKIMGINDFTRFPNLKMIEISEGINYIKCLLFSTKNNSDLTLVLPKSLRPHVCVKEGKVEGTFEFCDTPKYVIVNGNKELKKHFEDFCTRHKNSKIKIFDTKQDLEKCLHGNLSNKNITHNNFETFEELEAIPGDQPTKVIYKPEISYLRVFDLKTVVSLVFPPLFIYLIISRVFEINKQNQEIQKENKKLEAQKSKDCVRHKPEVINELKEISSKQQRHPQQHLDTKIKNNLEKGYF